MKLQEAPGLVLLGWEEDYIRSLNMMGLLAKSSGRTARSEQTFVLTPPLSNRRKVFSLLCAMHSLYNCPRSPACGCSQGCEPCH